MADEEDPLEAARREIGERDVKKADSETDPVHVVIGFLVIVLLGGWIWSLVTGGDDGSDAEITAQVMCENWVSDQLRSPGSADFEPSPNQQVVEVNASTYRVTAYVDSQNGFGAMLRSNYVCVVKMVDPGNPDGDWTLVDLDLN